MKHAKRTSNQEEIYPGLGVAEGLTGKNDISPDQKNEKLARGQGGKEVSEQMGAL